MSLGMEVGLELCQMEFLDGVRDGVGGGSGAGALLDGVLDDGARKGSKPIIVHQFNFQCTQWRTI